ncbi:MAG: hypothetical protein IJM46_12310 [Oscillospiraceae bacterium]|nr:hypothetical protein [Oscillospiraceae bacterium]
MKDQDYIKIMDRISKDKIEEAFTWDASAQKNRRSIRRLSAGIGAIAAAIAVVIGTIGYDAYRDRLLADSGAETSGLSEDSLNLLGGHGEIRGFIGSSGTPLFRDDDCYYMPTIADAENTVLGGGIREAVYRKWAINGSTASETVTCDDNLLTDGEQVYTYHDHQIFVTDGNGNETFFSAVPWKPCSIQKLGNDHYFVTALVEDSWIDNNPQPNVVIDKSGETINHFVDYGDVRPDGNGTTIYYRQENQIYCAPIYAPDHGYLLADAGDTPDCLLDWTVANDALYYLTAENGSVRYCTKQLNPDAPVESVTVNDPDDPVLYDQLRKYLYFSRQQTELHTVTYTYRDDVPEFHVYTSGQPIYPPNVSSECYSYIIPSAELWGDHLPDMNERPFMEFFDTGEHIIFTLPQDGIRGEQLVQLGKESGAYQYMPARMRDQASEAHSTETNALGGKGRIRAFEDKSDVSETDGSVLSVAEDDEYVYDLERCLRARKTDGNIVFEAFSVPGVPQYDPEHNQEQNLFVTCGMVLTFNQGALYELKTDGSLTPLLTLSEDSAGNPLKDVSLAEVRGFAPDSSGRPEKLFLRGDAQFRDKPDKDSDCQINAILNLKTGKYDDLDFTGLASKYIKYYVKEDAVYVIGRYDAKAAAKLTGGEIQDENSYVLVKFVDDGTCIPVSTSEWKFGIFLEAFFDQDRNIWFLDEYGKCCKGNIDDRSVTEGSTEEMYSVKDSVAGVKYREGSCVHIAVSVVDRQKSGRDKPVSMIVYTIDGGNVSSYTVQYPA